MNISFCSKINTHAKTCLSLDNEMPVQCSVNRQHFDPKLQKNQNHQVSMHQRMLYKLSAYKTGMGILAKQCKTYISHATKQNSEQLAGECEFMYVKNVIRPPYCLQIKLQKMSLQGCTKQSHSNSLQHHIMFSTLPKNAYNSKDNRS